MCFSRLMVVILVLGLLMGSSIAQAPGDVPIASPPAMAPAISPPSLTPAPAPQPSTAAPLTRPRRGVRTTPTGNSAMASPNRIAVAGFAIFSTFSTMLLI